ncbi:non-specific lipid transfer protein GPI-anchored 12 isoform X3 [Rhodamnia argentea]|uniref:Non-specific lipid transfer protein GPI-anchored 12 isoform X3 n=1 Tax=Rhodamnia argentea TaxID=178133 RepID=A0A8B8NJN7_9MYRT|nr:non-specific lipid transfer protein GPI-anchored 12 isoform X3 [Rhodamnia argentea]
MTAARFTVLIVAASLLAASCEVSSQAPAPGPSADCSNSLLNMSDCLTYVEAGSNVTAPDEKCCPELAGMVENSPACLCQLIGKNNSFGIDIDVNRALRLPSACDVVTPPASLCAAVGVPISSEGPAAPGTPSSNKVNGASTSYYALSTFVLVSDLQIVALSIFS